MVLFGAMVRPGLMFVTASILSPRQILCSSRQPCQKYSYILRFISIKSGKTINEWKNNLAMLLYQGNLGPWLTYADQSSQCERFSQHCGRIRINFKSWKI